VRSPGDFDNAYQAITRQRPDALIWVNDPLTGARRKDLADFAIKNGLPSISGYREFVDAGALMPYGPDSADLHRRAASFVDRVLKGEKPGDLPVEQPNKLDLVINTKTAKALGITVPPSLLPRADEVIARQPRQLSRGTADRGLNAVAIPGLTPNGHKPSRNPATQQACRRCAIVSVETGSAHP
jgi:ABC transporter substrate binding protein